MEYFIRRVTMAKNTLFYKNLAKDKIITVCFLAISFSSYTYSARTKPNKKVIKSALSVLIGNPSINNIVQEPPASRNTNDNEATLNTINTTVEQPTQKTESKISVSISDVFICTDNEDGTILIESTKFPKLNYYYFSGFDYTKANQRLCHAEERSDDRVDTLVSCTHYHSAPLPE